MFVLLSFKIIILTDPSTASSRNGEVGVYFTIISFNNIMMPHYVDYIFKCSALLGHF